jgi:hypothetical protein
LRGINLDPKSQEFRDFGDYLVVRHAPERLALGMRTYADDRQNNQKWMQARQAELEEKYPQFAAAAENLDTFQKNVLKHYALKCGLITPEAYKNMLKDYPHYVPFFRTGFKTKGDALKKAKGSGRNIVNPVDNIITSTVKIMNLACHNAIDLALREVALTAGVDASIIEQIPDPQVPQTFNMRGIKERLHNEIADINIARGVDPDTQDLLHEMVDNIDNTITQFQTGRAKKDRNEIVIMVDGKPEFWKVNDENLFSSLTSMDYRSSNMLINLYAKATRFMTSNITGNNIVWSIFSNAKRDLDTLYNYSETKNVFKLAKLIGDTYVQSARELRGKSVSDYYSEYLSMGAAGAPVWAGSDTFNKDMRKLINSRKRKLFGHDLANYNPLKYARWLSETIEMGPRYATYRLMREKGYTPQAAFYEAMDITTNFRKKGIAGKELNKVAQFFNANVQGLDHALRYFSAEDLKGKPKETRFKAIRARMIFLIVTSALTAVLSHIFNHWDEDKKEDYNRYSNYFKNYYLNIPIGDGKFLSIPKNHELSVLESLFERALEFGLDKNDRAFDEFYDYFIEQLAPPILAEMLQFPADVVSKGPQKAIENYIVGNISDIGVVGVAAQVAMNKNYLGTPIVPQSYQKLAPKMQYNKKTSELAYLIGQAFNISPMKLDHFANNFLGYLWKYQAALLPINAGDVKGEFDPTLGVKGTYIRDSLRSNDVSNWIYDKAEESEMRYTTEGDNILEMSLDAYMRDRYSNYNRLSKDEEETKEDRKLRKAVLNELIDYQKGKIPRDHRTVNDLVNETGDKSYLPSVKDTHFNNGKGGERVDLTSAEYMDYQSTYENLYYEFMNDSIDKTEDPDKWEYTEKLADSLALYMAKTKVLEEKGIESNVTSKFSDHLDVVNADFDTVVDKSYDIANIKEEYKETKEKQQKVRSEIAGLSPEMKELLWEMAGWKVSTLNK